MSMFSQRSHTVRGAWSVLSALILAIVVFGGSIPAQAQSAAGSFGDYGDAPDTTNSTPWPMRAYPWTDHMEREGFIHPPKIPANYPTVVDAKSTTPQGPWHRNPTQRAWLGADAGSEEHADHGVDNDYFMTNIEPNENRPSQYPDSKANWDNYDDSLGFNQSIILPNCAETTFVFKATGAAKAGTTSNYLNVWFDFNRDGDFNDNILCKGPSDTTWQHAPEQAVRNMPITIAPGHNTFMTRRFRSSHSDYNQLIWMRMTLTSTEVSSTDGSGPPDGHQHGETEDYLLTNYESDESADAMRTMDDIANETYGQAVVNVGYFTGGY